MISLRVPRRQALLIHFLSSHLIRAGWRSLETFIQMITDKPLLEHFRHKTSPPHLWVCVGFDKWRLFLLPSEPVLSSHFPRPGLSSETSQNMPDPSSISKALWTFEGKYNDTKFMASAAPWSPILDVSLLRLEFWRSLFYGLPPHSFESHWSCNQLKSDCLFHILHPVLWQWDLEVCTSPY